VGQRIVQEEVQEVEVEAQLEEAEQTQIEQV
jgi:hypothetical protein